MSRSVADLEVGLGHICAALESKRQHVDALHVRMNVTVCCSVLQCVAVCCSVLQCVCACVCMCVCVCVCVRKQTPTH